MDLTALETPHSNPPLVRPPARLQLEWATFSPLRAIGELPGEGVAFQVDKGWAGQLDIMKAGSCSTSLVQSRGLSAAEHLQRAIVAAHDQHPLAQPPLIPEGNAIAISGALALGPQVNELRLRRIALVKTWVREMQVEQDNLAATVHPSARRFAEKPTLVLLRLLDIIRSPAREALAEVHHGLADLGTPRRSGLFPPVRESRPPSWDLPKLLGHAQHRNPDLVARLTRHHPHAKTLWKQGEAAESTGAVGEWRDLTVWSNASNVVFCRKFPVKQNKVLGDEFAEGAVMSEEIRACADASDGPAGCCLNLAWASRERIVCSDSEVILAEMLASQLAFQELPNGSKDDLQKAYHQVGRRRNGVTVIQLFWHPELRRVVGREMLAQDFGTAGAVTNCNVVFRSLRDIANRWLYINVDNYFDDFWCWEPSWSVQTARFGLRTLFELLGYAFNASKRREGKRLPLLGLSLEAASEGPRCSNLPRRQEPLAQELEQVAATPPETVSASSVVGRTVFASRGLKGKAGVHARRPLFATLKRCQSGHAPPKWPPEAVVAMLLWAQLVRCGPCRTLPLTRVGQQSAVLYCDAALSSSRAAAMIIFLDSSGREVAREGFSRVLSPSFLRTLGPEESHAINGAEIWWIVKAIELWAARLRGRCVLVFGDNFAAISGCISGYSASVYMARLVGAVHETLCEYDIAAWFEWVHTDSNPLDEASRAGGEEALLRHGATICLVDESLRSNGRHLHPDP